jgi:hypothetical protein
MAMTLKETLAQLKSLGNEKVRAHNKKNGIGVTTDYVKAGDPIKARCRRLRVVPKGHDNDCILGFLKARDGTIKDWSGNNAPLPADF